MITAPKTQVDEESIKYQARTKLAELAGQIASSRSLNKVNDLILTATKIRLWLKALDYSDYLTRNQREKIWYALIKIAGVYDFPIAPVLSRQDRPAILNGTGNTVTVNNTYTDSVEFTNGDVDTPSEVVDSFAYSIGTSARWDYLVKQGTDQRSGTFITTWLSDGSAISAGLDISTPDIGDTSDVVLSVDINAGAVRLIATVASSNWSISGKRYLI